MRRHFALFASLVLVPAALSALSACSDDEATTPANTDGGTTPGADGGINPTDSSTAQDSAVADSSKADTSTPAAAVRCTQAEFDAPAGNNGGDYTVFPGVDISFPTGPAPAQYTQRCAKVKVGADVTFAGSFTAHPLQPNGGDTPTPIPTQTTNTTNGTLTFKPTAAGTFGYQCSAHPTSMFGAIQVVP